MAKIKLDKSKIYKTHQEEKVSSFLRDSRKKGEEEDTAEYAKSVGLPYLDLNIFPIDQENLNMISEEDARKKEIVLLRRKKDELSVGILNYEDKETFQFLKDLERNENIKVTRYIVSRSSIEKAWENYKRVKLVDRLDLMRVSLTEESLNEFTKEIKDLIDLEKKISKVSTTEVINVITAGAIKLDASDIHFEPTRNGKLRLRYRIDGVLQDVAEFEGGFYPTVLSRIKMISGMMINVRDVSQDGRFSIKLDERDIDVRVSILPGNYGEAVVIRLLNQDISNLKIGKVGLEGIAYERLVNESEKKQGMIINSGPTGSGKTTTLYAIINMINTPDKKIITIEDPVEYHLKGIVQTQIEVERGYTFANGLRSIVRQDPDILLVGEIRDEETAEIAIHSSLTGHLVLSTIHANTAAGVIPRLIDLGIKPSLINSALNICIAQRLVRKLCPDCREKYKPAPETVEALKKMISIISPKAQVEIPKEISFLYKSKGCPKCRGIGYKGRIGIFEILKMSERIKKDVEGFKSAEEITKSALEDGMMTMEQDGIIKVLKGETSVEELQRVVGKGDYLLELYEKIVIQSLARSIKIEKKIFESIKDKKNNPSELKFFLEKASSREIIKYTLLTALTMRAGDIHIEPGEKEYKIRYRIDGVLQNIASLPMSEFLSILNEIKALAGFEIEKRQGSIDGRFTIAIDEEIEEIEDKKVDVRVSIILGGYGDIVVMRLLNQSIETSDITKLGLHKINLNKIRQEMEKPNGMIINTGPTGSGKTTTLYSILKILNKPELKIITIEDPIEYQVNGVLQTQINEKEGYTFANSIRSFLRQNPDIIMVGEIRDEETAKVAYQAALTGHLVLTTLHTNGAAASVQRLLNMNLEISDIISGTNCFIAQRLVRKLCEKCKKKRETTEEEKNYLKEVFENLPSAINKKEINLDYIYEAVGCDECHNLGYQGRIPIMEVLQIDKKMAEVLTKKPITNEIEAFAVKNGMLTMKQDGYLRVLKGETTLEEIKRVAG